MANSSIIELAKNNLIREIIKDDLIVKAIDADDIESSEDLINTSIFDFDQNPNTINTVKTFLTITVHIPYSRFIETDPLTFVKPTIVVRIVSHAQHMTVDNIPKVKSNRNDYISRLIDQKFNGIDGIGIGKMRLVSNTEGSYQQDYLYREMTFMCVELNRTLCSEE